MPQKGVIMDHLSKIKKQLNVIIFVLGVQAGLFIVFLFVYFLLA